MSYRERLTPWVVVRLLPSRQHSIVRRFRSRADADGHLQFLHQQIPKGNFSVVFDSQLRIGEERGTLETRESVDESQKQR